MAAAIQSTIKQTGTFVDFCSAAARAGKCASLHPFWAAFRRIIIRDVRINPAIFYRNISKLLRCLSRGVRACAPLIVSERQSVRRHSGLSRNRDNAEQVPFGCGVTPASLTLDRPLGRFYTASVNYTNIHAAAAATTAAIYHLILILWSSSRRFSGAAADLPPTALLYDRKANVQRLMSWHLRDFLRTHSHVSRC